MKSKLANFEKVRWCEEEAITDVYRRQKSKENINAKIGISDCLGEERLTYTSSMGGDYPMN